MQPTAVTSPSLIPLVAELERLSQGRGLTFDERRYLTGDLLDGDAGSAFVARRIEELRNAQRWQPLALAGLVALVSTSVVVVSQGWPSTLSLILILPAFATPVLKHRQIARKIRVYESLQALAAPHSVRYDGQISNSVGSDRAPTL